MDDEQLKELIQFLMSADEETLKRFAEKLTPDVHSSIIKLSLIEPQSR